MYVNIYKRKKHNYEKDRYANVGDLYKGTLEDMPALYEKLVCLLLASVDDITNCDNELPGVGRLFSSSVEIDLLHIGINVDGAFANIVE